ncbi:MAG: adenylyl-sulfate kinase [Methylacidiphilales bacterium]|nr:adenylyl-sulfate kinase [Candidatus Methylacidiphilales bacterium]
MTNILPQCFWFTGLSGSGKSTLAEYTKNQLISNNFIDKIIILDGDAIRTGLSSNLGFSQLDRTENLRRIAEVAKLFLSEKYLVIVSCITPLNSQRNLARTILDSYIFTLCYLQCAYQVCEKRDVKGLYKKAKNNSSIKLTGSGSEFEEPTTSDLTIKTDELSLQDSYLLIHGRLVKSK